MIVLHRAPRKDPAVWVPACAGRTEDDATEPGSPQTANSPPSRQRAALGDDVADGAGERRLAARGEAERELDPIELRQPVRMPFGTAELLARAEPQRQGGIAEAGIDGAGQRREALRLAGDGPVELRSAQAAQRLVAISAAFGEGDQRDRVAVPRGRGIAEPGHRFAADRSIRGVRRRALEEGEIEPAMID